MNGVELLILAASIVVPAVVACACGEILRKALGWEIVGAPERALLAVGGGVAFAIVCMVANIVAGGAVFGLPVVVPALALAAVYVGRAGLRVGRLREVDRWGLVLAAVVLGLLYVVPVVLAGSGVRTGDPPWHLGWTAQLLGGEAVPTGPAPVFGVNAYPWGWHAVLATMVRLVPGSDAVIAHDAMHVILVGAIPLAAACLARRLRPDAGWAAAACASVVGGFGWITAGGSAFDPSPRAARFGADLVVASPNSVFELMPPALPRELGLVLLGLAGLLLVRALGVLEHRAAVVAGVAFGVVGLVSVPMLVSGLAWFGASVVVARRASKGVVVPFLGGLLITFALWVGPVASNYIRYGGFVNITPSLGKEWPVATALWSWGVLLPLVICGAVVIGRRLDLSRRVVLGFAAASAVLIALAMLRGALDWNLAGNATVLHQGRTWPPAHLVGAALAGAGAMGAWAWARERSRLLAGLGLAAVATVGAASPVLASDALRTLLVERRAGFIYSAPELRRDGQIRDLARELDTVDVVLAYDDVVAFHLFEFSGARLARYDHPRLESNDLRIRFRDMALRWDEEQPFCPSQLVLEESSGLRLFPYDEDIGPLPGERPCTSPWNRSS